MAHVIFGRNNDGVVVVKEAKFIPLITHVYKDLKITTFKVKDYSLGMAFNNYIKKIFDNTYSYYNMINFFKDIIDQKFLDFNL